MSAFGASERGFGVLIMMSFLRNGFAPCFRPSFRASSSFYGDSARHTNAHSSSRSSAATSRGPLYGSQVWHTPSSQKSAAGCRVGGGASEGEIENKKKKRRRRGTRERRVCPGHRDDAGGLRGARTHEDFVVVALEGVARRLGAEALAGREDVRLVHERLGRGVEPRAAVEAPLERGPARALDDVVGLTMRRVHHHFRGRGSGAAASGAGPRTRGREARGRRGAQDRRHGGREGDVRRSREAECARALGAWGDTVVLFSTRQH